MRNASILLLHILLASWVATAARAGELTVAKLPLTDVIKVGDRMLGHLGEAEIMLPPLPAKPGRVVVLRFRAVSYAERPSGWNWNAEFALNGVPLGRYTQSGRPRLVGRDAMFSARGRRWQLFSGSMVRLMYAPDVDVGDSMLPGGQGASFAFDISDVARGVDGNILRITNIRKSRSSAPERELIVRDIEVGWLDKSLLPTSPSLVPERAAIKNVVSLGKLSLAQGTAGGFAVSGQEGIRLLVETTVSADRDAASSLTAQDTIANDAEVRVTREGPAGFRVTAIWPHVSLVRRLYLADGLLHWKERWTNKENEIVGLPFRHRLFLWNKPAQIRLAGDLDNSDLPGCATNPTIFLASKERPGSGAGLTLESDWLRLLARLHHEGGVAELYSLDLALPPRGSIDFYMTVALVDEGGYWTFINGVRRRWGLNGWTMERPFFWNWAGKRAEMTAEAWKKAFGHLGPVVVAAWPGLRHPWVPMGFDLETLIRNRYPKLPEDAPRTPGKSPDLDLEAFLTFQHREAYWKRYAEYVALAHKAVPNVQVVFQMELTHDPVYAPMAHRWPDSEDAILTAEGKPFESPYYRRAYLGDWAAKDWTMIYHAVRSGSAYLAAKLRDVRRSLDDCGADGLYLDEFSFGERRDYTRYDYSRWDGYSADLDGNGNVVRLKSDNAFTSESAQIQIATEVVRRGKFFLGNGCAHLRSVGSLPIARFVEGGNGMGMWHRAHLATVPLILGNFGDQGATRKGVFRSVRAVVEHGCLYSPKECNLVLDGPDNFVCKQYPISIREIGPGVIKGDQRLITIHSGEFNWPGHKATVTVYAYDENGDLLNRGNLPHLKVRATGTLRITVPQGGLVIAEIR